MTAPINPLGQATPDRYREGSWEAALLARMGYWVQRIHQKGLLVDIGCGEGALLNFVGLRGVGVDLNHERLAWAASQHLSVCLADAACLPVASHSAETAVSMEVLEHLPDMSSVMGEVHRVLRPGGHWIISVPGATMKSWYEMRREKRPYYCSEDEHYREFTPADLPGFEHRFMRTQSFEKMLEEHGFTILHRDGVQYRFPQWFSRWPALQGQLESADRDRLWSRIPVIKQFPHWLIRVLQARHGS